MINLSVIANKLENHFQIKINGFFDNKVKIDTIHFLTEDNNIVESANPSTIYITNCKEYSAPFGSCVLVINSPIIKNELNTLYIEESLNIFQVYNLINEEIKNSNIINTVKERMFNALQTGGGIKSIINIAYSFTENPITVCDTNFSILEVYPDFNNEIDFELQGNTKYLKLKSINSMQSKKLLEKMFSSKHAFIAYNEISDQKVIFCSIRINKSVVGYICIIGLNRAFNDMDLEFAEVVVKMISVEMQKTGFFVENNGLLYESLIKDLIEKRFDNTQYVKQRMLQIGYELTKYMYMITFTFQNTHEKRLNIGYYIEQINSIFKKGMCIGYNGQPVLLLLSDDNQNPFSELESTRLENFLICNQLYASASYPYTNILDTATYYTQSIETLQILPLPNNKNHLLFYEDYCLSHIFNKCATLISLYATIHPDIIFLKDYDKVNNTEYLKTLGCYLKCGRNAVKCSNMLNIHKSTFFYRLTKINDLTGITIDDSKKLFLYELSFHIMDSMNV